MAFADDFKIRAVGVPQNPLGQTFTIYISLGMLVPNSRD